jgi:hypothetical protein
MPAAGCIKFSDRGTTGVKVNPCGAAALTLTPEPGRFPGVDPAELPDLAYSPLMHDIDGYLYAPGFFYASVNKKRCWRTFMVFVFFTLFNSHLIHITYIKFRISIRNLVLTI